MEDIFFLAISFGPKNEKSHNGADLRKKRKVTKVLALFLVWRKVILVQLRAPL